MNRAVNEAARKGDNEPNLEDLYGLLQSVVMRLDSIENDMKMRLSATEESLENAHNRISNSECLASRLTSSKRLLMNIDLKNTTFSFMDYTK